METRSVDSLMESLGKPGKFQVIAFICLCWNNFIVMTNHVAMVFYAAKTNYHCKVDDNNLVPTVIKNNKVQWDGCHVYAGKNTTETTPCTNGWTYYLGDGEVTIISEFDLVCDDAYKSDLATTIYFSGVAFSGFLFGLLADKYGRKPVIGFTLVSSGVVGVAIVIFKNYVAFVILRFFMGFLMQGLLCSTFILTMELFSIKYRIYAGVAFILFEGIIFLTFDLLAYLIRDWKYIQLALAILSFVQILSLCIVPESLRWHLVYNNFTQAEKIIKRTVMFNNLSFPHKLFDKIKCDSMKKDTLSTQNRKANLLDVFRSSELRKNTLILSAMWFSLSVTFYGLAFNISFLFGDKYLNFAISSIMDMCAVAVMLWIVPRYGRRRPLSLAFFSSAVANCICSIMASRPATASTAVNYLGTAMAIFGKTAIQCTVSVIYTFTSELYPTVVRNISFGVNTLWARIGGMVAPQIFFLVSVMDVFLDYWTTRILRVAKIRQST